MSDAIVKDVCRRNPGCLSKATGAQLVVDHFLRGSRLIKKKKIVQGPEEGACSSKKQHDLT